MHNIHELFIEYQSIQLKLKEAYRDAKYMSAEDYDDLIERLTDDEFRVVDTFELLPAEDIERFRFRLRPASREVLDMLLAQLA